MVKLACHARLNPHPLSRSLPEAKNSCQPVTIKNRDKIHEKVGFLGHHKKIYANDQNTKFGDKIALFWTFKLLRKVGTQSRKIGTVGNLA